MNNNQIGHLAENIDIIPSGVYGFNKKIFYYYNGVYIPITFDVFKTLSNTYYYNGSNLALNDLKAISNEIPVLYCIDTGVSLTCSDTEFDTYDFE